MAIESILNVVSENATGKDDNLTMMQLNSNKDSDSYSSLDEFQSVQTIQGNADVKFVKYQFSIISEIIQSQVYQIQSNDESHKYSFWKRICKEENKIIF